MATLLRVVAIFIICIAKPEIRVLGNDVCYASFNEFLKCLSAATNQRIHLFEEDASANVQNKIVTCFKSHECAAPDFSRATVSNFLVEPWANRVNILLDLLENTDPRVQQCMIQFFNGIAQRKIENCVRQYGEAEVKNFEMPQLPDWQGLDISKIKSAVLNRMAVTLQAMDCSKSIPSDEKLQEVIDCTKAARLSSKFSICQPRDNCIKTKITDSFCSARYDKVQRGTCTCFATEKQQMQSGRMNLENWKELKETFFQGGMEREYKKCHERNNLPYPQQRVNAAKAAIKQAVADVFFKGGLPDRVRLTLRTLAQSMRDMSGTGEKLFCQSCRDENVLSTDSSEAAQIRSLAAGNFNSVPPVNNANLANVNGQSNFGSSNPWAGGGQSNFPQQSPLQQQQPTNFGGVGPGNVQSGNNNDPFGNTEFFERFRQFFGKQDGQRSAKHF